MHTLCIQLNPVEIILTQIRTRCIDFNMILIQINAMSDVFDLKENLFLSRLYFSLPH